MTLGKRLKAMRGKRTQQEIANSLSIARARYSHYENDHVQPDNDLLMRMADLHGVSVDFLLGGGENNSGENTLFSIAEEELELINTYNKLNQKDKDYILELMNRLKKE